MRKTLLTIGLLLICGSVVLACPLTFSEPPPDLTGFKKMSNSVEGAIYWLEQTKASLEAGAGTFKNENGRKALINKIEATLNMLKTGNTNGAIQKIQHDIQERLNDWLVEPQVLPACYCLEVAVYMLQNPQYTSYWILPFPPLQPEMLPLFKCSTEEGDLRCWIEISLW
ncbi:MAG: hypothetical protein AB1349_13015 [Elusimicrobiota bacterium]